MSHSDELRREVELLRDLLPAVSDTVAIRLVRITERIRDITNEMDTV